MQNVVIFSGGRGTRSIVQALLERGDCQVTTIVNAWDDGKSTGEIRRFFDMPGPSDIRKNQEAMLPKDHPHYRFFEELYQFRFPVRAEHDAVVDALLDFATGNNDFLGAAKIKDDGVLWVLRRLVEEFLAQLARREYALGQQFDFGDCSLMNCLFAGAYELLDRDFLKAAAMMGRLAHIRGRVLPASRADMKLAAIRENGEVLCSEAEIVDGKSAIRIREIFLLNAPPDRQHLKSLTPDERLAELRSLNQEVPATEAVLQAIGAADLIIYGPGTQHSSLYPTYVLKGIPEAIARNRRAPKIMITNIARDNDIPGYTAGDLIAGTQRHLSRQMRRAIKPTDLIELVLVNRPGAPRTTHHISPEVDQTDLPGLVLIPRDYEDPSSPGKHDGRLVVESCLEVLRGSLLDTV